MRCDDDAESVDDRDASVINGVFTAGMILRSAMAHIESDAAARHVEAAIDELDGALREIRLAAFARRLGSRRESTRLKRSRVVRPTAEEVREALGVFHPGR